MTSPCNWRIGLTEASLLRGLFLFYGLPTPNLAQYSDHTTAIDVSDGSQVLQGYQSLTVLWTRLSGKQAARVRRFIDDARSGTGLLFLTIDRGDTTAAGHDWIDIQGYPHRQSNLSQDQIAGRVGQHTYANVQLVLGNVTVLNDPSTYAG